LPLREEVSGAYCGTVAAEWRLGEEGWPKAPLGPSKCLPLHMNPQLVLTGSGWMQEETTVLGLPCIPMWNNMAPPIRFDVATNQLVGNGKEAMLVVAHEVFLGRRGMCERSGKLGRGCSPTYCGDAGSRVGSGAVGYGAG